MACLEHDSNTVAMLVTLDFLKGPERMAWRITECLKGHTLSREDEDNTAAVVAVLALALGLVMSAFAGPEFEDASGVAKMFEKPR
jgi:hypothetical protein